MIRPATLADVPLIFSTWILGGRECALANKLAPNFCGELHDEIEALLTDPDTHVLIACDPRDEDVAWGYIVFCRQPAPRVHWMFVKARLRRAGVGRSLLEAAVDVARPFAATHISPVGRAVLKHVRTLRCSLPPRQSKPRKVVTHGEPEQREEAGRASRR